MPAFVRTPADEARWSKAKGAVKRSRDKSEDSFQDQDWALVNSIYHKMQKAEVMSRLMEVLSKKMEDDEDDEDYDIQDHGQDEDGDEDLESQGFHEVDPDQEGSDDADQWLAEHDPEKKGGTAQEAASDQEEPIKEAEAEVKPKSGGSYSEWAPKGYSDQEKAEIDKHIAAGYSPREAERMAGAHKGPTNLQDALTHPLKPSHPSEKMLGELKALAKPWLENAERHGKINADPTKNPMKFAAGQMLQAHEGATKDYNKAYNEFLSSDAVKNLKGLDRHKAVQAWKQDWKTQNPEYSQGVGKVSEAQKHYKEASDAKQADLNERLKHILTGGHAEGAMSMQEAAQHAGGSKGEDEGYSSGTVQDPAAQFAQANPEFMQQHQAKQAAAAPPAPKKDLTAAKQVILRKNPDVADRFKRIMSARASQGVKPQGEGQ